MRIVIIALVLGSRSRETAWQIYALPVLIPYALFVVVRYLRHERRQGAEHHHRDQPVVFEREIQAIERRSGRTGERRAQLAPPLGRAIRRS